MALEVIFKMLQIRREFIDMERFDTGVAKDSSSNKSINIDELQCVLNILKSRSSRTDVDPIHACKTSPITGSIIW